MAGRGPGTWAIYSFPTQGARRKEEQPGLEPVRRKAGATGSSQHAAPKHQLLLFLKGSFKYLYSYIFIFNDPRIDKFPLFSMLVYNEFQDH